RTKLESHSLNISIYLETRNIPLTNGVVAVHLISTMDPAATLALKSALECMPSLQIITGRGGIVLEMCIPSATITDFICAGVFDLETFIDILHRMPRLESHHLSTLKIVGNVTLPSLIPFFDKCEFALAHLLLPDTSLQGPECLGLMKRFPALRSLIVGLSNIFDFRAFVTEESLVEGLRYLNLRTSNALEHDIDTIHELRAARPLLRILLGDCSFPAMGIMDQPSMKYTSIGQIFIIKPSGAATAERETGA
ncbi:hypothetical protein C8J56DRAFT_1103626, partial [Mycena floridula]